MSFRRACASLIGMHVLVPLVIALVPLLITPGLLSYFDITPKIALLLLGLSLSLLYPRARISNLRALLGTRMGRWFTIFLVAMCVSSAVATAFSTHPLLSLNGGNWRRYGLLGEAALLLFVLFSAGWLAADPANARRLLRACVAAGALASLYGIAQYFGWDPWLPPAAYQAGEGPFTIVRPPGTLGHADYFAAWLAAISFLALELYRLEQARGRRIAALAVCALAVFAILLSGTRSALLGLLAGSIVFAIQSRPRFNARFLAALGMCAGALLLFVISPAGTKLRARVHWSSEDVWGGARLLLWRDSFRMAVHRPWAGYGPETFATEFPRFESAELARAYPDFYHESPHNMFLDQFTGRGAIGLALLLGLTALALWAARQAKRPALAAALVALLICQQFVVFILATALYFYLVIALLIVTPARSGPDHRASRWLIPWSVAAGLLFAAFAVRLLVADRLLALVDHRIEAGDPTAASRQYAEFLRWQPRGAGSDLGYSRAMTQLADHTRNFALRLQAAQQALDAAIRATRTAEDRQNAWYNLAMLLAIRGDAPGVERSLRNAIAWAPNWFKPHWALAQLLEAANRRAAALDQARRAVELDGGRDAEVSQTWKKLQNASHPHP